MSGGPGSGDSASFGSSDKDASSGSKDIPGQPDGVADDEKIDDSLKTSTSNGNSQYSPRSGSWHPLTHSGCMLFGPTPHQQLGPKAKLAEAENDENRYYGLVDPSTQTIEWQMSPKNVLIVKKLGDSAVTQHFMKMAEWLAKEKQMKVFVEDTAMDDGGLQNEENAFFTQVGPALKRLSSGSCDTIDLVICLGGDGTLLHISQLFQKCCPPVLGFHLGSLGFLTPFSIRNFREHVEAALKANTGLTLRSRLKCQVRRREDNKPDPIDFEHLVLNEMVVDRGASSSVAHLDIYCNDRHLTTLVGDGLIVSTPTGSTAYSAAAGASMVHPSVPGIILTPICPHSLSFRPIVLPPGVELKVMVSEESRSRQALVSFDGKNSRVLEGKRYLRVTTSVYPVPCISHQDHLSDWFNSLAECLHWNRREIKRKGSFKASAKLAPS